MQNTVKANELYQNYLGVVCYMQIDNYDELSVEISQTDLSSVVAKTEQIIFKGNDEIKEGFSEIRTIVREIKNIRSKLWGARLKDSERKELVKEKKENIKKMTSLWNSLSRTDLSELRKEESIKIVNSQKNFIDDLLEYYKD